MVLEKERKKKTSPRRSITADSRLFTLQILETLRPIPSIRCVLGDFRYRITHTSCGPTVVLRPQEWIQTGFKIKVHVRKTSFAIINIPVWRN